MGKERSTRIRYYVASSPEPPVRARSRPLYHPIIFSSYLSSSHLPGASPRNPSTQHHPRSTPSQTDKTPPSARRTSVRSQNERNSLAHLSPVLDGENPLSSSKASPAQFLFWQTSPAQRPPRRRKPPGGSFSHFSSAPLARRDKTRPAPSWREETPHGTPAELSPHATGDGGGLSSLALSSLVSLPSVVLGTTFPTPDRRRRERLRMAGWRWERERGFLSPRGGRPRGSGPPVSAFASVPGLGSPRLFLPAFFLCALLEGSSSLLLLPLLPRSSSPLFRPPSPRVLAGFALWPLGSPRPLARIASAPRALPPFVPPPPPLFTPLFPPSPPPNPRASPPPPPPPGPAPPALFRPSSPPFSPPRLLHSLGGSSPPRSPRGPLRSTAHPLSHPLSLSLARKEGGYLTPPRGPRGRTPRGAPTPSRKAGGGERGPGLEGWGLKCCPEFGPPQERGQGHPRGGGPMNGQAPYPPVINWEARRSKLRAAVSRR